MQLLKLETQLSNFKRTPNKIEKYDLLERYFNKELPMNSIDDVIATAGLLDREMYISEVTHEIANGIESMIRFWNLADDELDIPAEERKPIRIYIDSPGGSLTACFIIINAIELSHTPVYTYNIGCAYSAGFFIYIAGHKRFAYSLSSFLFHEGATTTGDFIDAHKFRNQADFYSTQLNQLKEHVLRYTKITEAEYEKIKKDDYWLTAKEAVEKGIVDEICVRGGSWEK